MHEERKNYQQTEASTLGLQPGEVVVSVGKNKRQPVQKWSGGLVWPGRVTLTDRALYFEVGIVFFPFSFYWEVFPCIGTHSIIILESMPHGSLILPETHLNLSGNFSSALNLCGLPNLRFRV